MKPEWYVRWKRFIGKQNLNLGCGFTPELGGPGENWANVDFNPDSPADFLLDFREIGDSGARLPQVRDGYDCILASHVLEHLETKHLYPLVYEVARSLKQGGHFIYIVPHGLNSKCYANPLHVQRLDESSYLHFQLQTYEREDSAGLGAGQGYRFARWEKVDSSMTPEKWMMGMKEEEMDYHRMHTPNAIEEIQCVLRLESLV